MKVEEAVCLWYECIRGKGLLISGLLLQEKALGFYKNVEGELVSLKPVTVGWTSGKKVWSVTVNCAGSNYQ